MATWSHNSREPLSNSLILESLCQILRNSALRSLRKPHRAPWLDPLPLPKKRHSKDTQLVACHHNLIVFLSLVRTATGLRGSWLYLRLVASYVALSILWIVAFSRLIVKDGNVPRRVPSLCGRSYGAVVTAMLIIYACGFSSILTGILVIAHLCTQCLPVQRLCGSDEEEAPGRAVFPQFRQ